MIITPNKPATDIKKAAAEVKTEVKADVKAAAAAVVAKKEEIKKDVVVAKTAVEASKKVDAKKAPAAKKAVAKKPAAKKAVAKKPVAKKEAKAPKAVEASFDSIFTAFSSKVKKAKFSTSFTATQITLNGNLDCQPLYVKVEDKKAEIAPYEYIGADFYIDADATAFAAVLNGKKDFYTALVDGSIMINGDAGKAIVFVKAVFG